MARFGGDSGSVWVQENFVGFFAIVSGQCHCHYFLFVEMSLSHFIRPARNHQFCKRVQQNFTLGVIFYCYYYAALLTYVDTLLILLLD